MAKGKGFLATVGLKKNPNAWGGAAVAAGAGDGIEALSIGLMAKRQIIPDQSITGRVTTREGDKGNLVVDGSAVFPLRYEGAGRLIAALMGLAGVPTTVDTSGRKHTFKIAGQTDGIYWTLAYEIIKDTLVYEFDFVKVKRITLRATIPGRVELEVEFIGHNVSDASAINTTTTIDTITLPANSEIAQARQMVVRMNGQGAGALGASDALIVSAFELTLDRPLEADFTSEFGDKSSEPMPPDGPAALMVPSGSLTFSQLQTGTGGNTAVVQAANARLLQKADIVFTGDGLAGAATEKYSHKVFLPMVVLGEGRPALAQGKLGWQIPFTCHHVSVAPTGFDAGHTDAVNWENTNKLTTDVLA